MLCVKQIDEIRKECLEAEKYTYKYKGEVDIPPLIMLDDLVSISECGIKTTIANSYINVKTSSKKLQFGTQKCKKIHIGKTCDKYKCQPLFVENWEENEVEECDSMDIKIEDVFDGEEIMEEKEDERYLGDVISQDGRNLKNIKSRVNKGTGIVRNILTMLDGIPFGKFYFEAAIILRNSLLVSSVLFNSEAWYNLTDAELDLLETVDVMLLRGILKAPKSTPKEMMFLELGVLPFREIIRKRRLAFLFYILEQKPDSMIYKVLESQMKNQTPKDWVTMVLSDFEKLKMDIKIEDLKKMNKVDYMRIIKRKIDHKTLKDLNRVKESHSKVRELPHPVLKIQKYFMPSKLNLSKEDCQLIFKLRSRVTEIKVNMKGKYDSYECTACGNEDESQEHVIQCNKLLQMNTDYNMEEIPDYKELLHGNVDQKYTISKIFKSNMKILQKIKKKD